MTRPGKRRLVHSDASESESDDGLSVFSAPQSQATPPPPSQLSTSRFQKPRASTPREARQVLYPRLPFTRQFTPIDPVQIALHNVCSSDFYVGSPGITRRVKWQKYKDHSILLVKGAERDTEAELEWVGEVDAMTSSYNLYVCGNWTGRYGDFTSAKARAQIVKPTRERWGCVAEEWEKVVAGFKAIRDSKSTPGASLSDGNQVVYDSQAPSSVKVRHAVFEAVPPGTHLEAEDTQDPFSMANWRCQTTEAQAALERIIRERKFRGRALPIYTAEEELLQPSAYEARLRGALVHVKARVVHQYFHRDRTDNFFADIREINIIDSPPPPPDSPSKRRFEASMRRYAEKRRRVG